MRFYFILLAFAIIVSTESVMLNKGRAIANVFNTTQRSIQLQDIDLASALKKERPRLKIVNGRVATRGQFCYQAYLQFTDERPRLKIVNGRVATRGQFCYQAYLQFTDGRSYWACGGSLVTQYTVLTAAHCVQGARIATVVLGAQDLSRVEAGRVVTSVGASGLRVHENYDSNLYYNDIALITLSRPVQLTQYICTVPVPNCSSSSSRRLTADSSNKNLYTISGWGKTSDSTMTYQLMYMNVSAELQNSCASFYKSRARYTVIQSQLCTSGAGGKSTCNGDSGGPLVQPDSSGTLVQQGIVSLGLSSCDLGAPSVYTDLNTDSFTAWLCPKLRQ